MKRQLRVDAVWDDEAKVWLATSPDIIGLCVEADTWSQMIEEVRLVAPELMELNGQEGESVALKFMAEAHLDVA